MTNHTEAEASEATLRMAKTLGTEFVRDPKWSETEANMPADEPVAWMYEHPSDGKYASPVRRFLHPGWTETPLYAVPPASPDRNAVLEEAAKVAEDKYAGHGAKLGTSRAHSYEHAGKCIAAAIRALRTEAPAQEGE